MTITAERADRLVEPTVLGAMRRHWLLVCLVVFACVDLALAYGVIKQEEYVATATVSAPRPAGSALQSDAQYLDSQVLLLNSRQVGDRAYEIVGASPAGTGIKRGELAPTIGRVEIIPPTGGSTGGYGTTIVTVQFTADSAAEAQVGVNALATAYDEVRSEEIRDQAASRVEGMDNAIAAAESPGDVAELRKERVQAVIDQGRDQALRASIASADRPEAPAGSGLLTLLGVGLILGLVVGGAAAFVRASRLRHVGGADVGRVLYDAPLLYELRTAPHPRDGRVTESDRLLGRAVAHRLADVDAPVRLAVVATAENRARSDTAAGLALALAETDVPVLAVDAGDGTMAEVLHPATPSGPRARRAGGEGPAPVESPWQDGLSVLDLSSSPGASDQDLLLREHADRVVVVDCPPATTSARGVDLLAGCGAAVVLVHADDPVRSHVELARWLELTETPVLGLVFMPVRWRGPLDLLPGRRSRMPHPAPDVAGSPVHPVQQSPARMRPVVAPRPATRGPSHRLRPPAWE